MLQMKGRREFHDSACDSARNYVPEPGLCVQSVAIGLKGSSSKPARCTCNPCLGPQNFQRHITLDIETIYVYIYIYTYIHIYSAAPHLELWMPLRELLWAVAASGPSDLAGQIVEPVSRRTLKRARQEDVASRG